MRSCLSNAVGGPLEPASFRMVKFVAHPAYSVDSAAVIPEEGTTARVMVMAQGRAVFRRVEVLHRDANKSVIQANTLRAKDRILVQRKESELASLSDGVAVQEASK